jgi:RNA polymerase sigma factor (sigma-70 family)
MSENREGDGFDPAQTGRIGHDVAALERFYLAHYDELVRYVAGQVADPHDVADLVADTFMSAVGAAARFDPQQGRTMPWLVGIARNQLRHFRRRRHSDQQAAQRIVGSRLLDADDIADLEERIAAEARGRRALSALAGLPAAQRELVELVDLQGFSPAEAAEVCGISPGAARVRLHRARATLRAAVPSRTEPTEPGVTPARPDLTRTGKDQPS